jgi:thiopurine S-methyltransferase
MHPDFWHERWQTRQIGFHRERPHPMLERWWPTLDQLPGSRVYVPLCGKSLDMVWLAVRGHRVVGTELSPIAVQEFFGEHGPAAPGVTQHGPFRRHASGPFEILEGDAFAVTPDLIGPVHAAYDRAALFALPPELRQRHVDSIAALLPAGSRSLVIVFQYPQALKAGPPFSVMPDEIERLYGPHFTVQELERIDIIGESPKFAEAGIEALYEVAYRLERR